MPSAPTTDYFGLRTRLPLPAGTLVGVAVALLAVAAERVFHLSVTGDAPGGRRPRVAHARGHAGGRRRPVHAEGRRDGAARIPVDRGGAVSRAVRRGTRRLARRDPCASRRCCPTTRSSCNASRRSTSSRRDILEELEQIIGTRRAGDGDRRRRARAHRSRQGGHGPRARGRGRNRDRGASPARHAAGRLAGRAVALDARHVGQLDSPHPADLRWRGRDVARLQDPRDRDLAARVDRPASAPKCRASSGSRSSAAASDVSRRISRRASGRHLHQRRRRPIPPLCRLRAAR